MRFLICCNGQPPAAALLHQAAGWADVIIAADGGANMLLAHEIVPDLITGDMDSYSRDALQRYLRHQEHKEGFDVSKTPELIPDADQESNDLEKALLLAERRQNQQDKKGTAEILICGATGYRLDHSLKNLSVMQQFLPHFSSLFMIDDYLCTFVHPAKEQLRLELPTGTPVSLFPLSGRVTGLSTKGLKYALNDDFLENGLRDGSSNEVAFTASETPHQAPAEDSGFVTGTPQSGYTTIDISYKTGQLVIMISPLNGMRWPLLS
jgi:thiamine pyrophosphokinase